MPAWHTAAAGSIFSSPIIARPASSGSQPEIARPGAKPSRATSIGPAASGT